jgi:hypothetical protein
MTIDILAQCHIKSKTPSGDPCHQQVFYGQTDPTRKDVYIIKRILVDKVKYLASGLDFQHFSIVRTGKAKILLEQKITLQKEIVISLASLVMKTDNQ